MPSAVSLPSPPATTITPAWIMANADVLAQYLQRIKALDGLEVVVTQNGASTRCPVKWSDLNGTIEITLG